MKYTINELANSKGVSPLVREALLQMEAELDAIKQARAAPVQEPVATLLQQSKENFERNFGSNGYADWIYKDLADLLDTPPAAQRQWVGLTDECRKQLINKGWSEYIAGIDDGRTFGEWMSVATEAKLKEKNT